MSRFVGVKNGSIRIISNAFFVNDDLTIVELSADLNEVTSQDLMLNYHLKNGKIELKKIKRPSKELKLAFISNYAMHCGLAQYAKFLLSELSQNVGDYKLFMEVNNNPIEPVSFTNNELIPDDKIIQCWERGKSLSELVKEIKIYEPDIILINHEWGIFNNSRYWLSMMNQLSNYRIIVIMHSIFHHPDKTIVEASIPEIIVHVDGAKKVLKEEKNISGKVYVINHGTFPCLDKTKLWNFYKSNNTFMQQGYLFKYKGFSNSIKAVKLLKEKYPDVFFTALCSESPFGKFEHQQYYEELMGLIEEYKLEENIGIIRGYQSDMVLNSFLRINTAAVFPYISDKNHECFGASGAAPYAMSKGIPVITSTVPHFSELPTIKANTPEEIAEELDKLFSNKKAIEDQILKQNIYLEENSWHNTALKFISIFNAEP